MFPIFRNKSFVLDEKLQQNNSKFAILFELRIFCLWFSWILFFPNRCPGKFYSILLEPFIKHIFLKIVLVTYRSIVFVSADIKTNTERCFTVLTITWQLLDTYLTITWQLLGYYLTITWQLHNNYVIITWLLLENYLTITQQLLEFDCTRDILTYKYVQI